jgi:hypothetical protein
MMNGTNTIRSLVGCAALLVAAFLTPAVVLAHCDGMDGPVVKAAQKALTAGNVNLALIWVQPDDEGTIKTAFQKTLVVRKLSSEAKELVDMYFFETLVRIHRAGEGAPYTGLKSAGRDLGPVIPAADKAIAEESVEPLLKLLPTAAHVGIRKHFKEVLARKSFKEDDVQAGRAYVEAYVAFMHAAEGVHEDGRVDATGHHHKDSTTPGHHHVESHQPPADREQPESGCLFHGSSKEVDRETHEHSRE